MAMDLMLYCVKSVSIGGTYQKGAYSRQDSFALTKILTCSFPVSKKVVHVLKTRCATCYALVYMPLMSTCKYHFKWIKKLCEKAKYTIMRFYEK